MKLEIEKNILNEHLNYVVRGISNKNLIPILNCIKIDLTEEGLYLTSTNNDIAIKTFIAANKIKNIDTLGSIVVAGRYFHDIIRKLPNDIITLEEVIDNKFNIYTKNSSFYLNCNRVEDFPILDLDLSANSIELNKIILKNLINQTIYAVSTDESRPQLTGLNINIKNDIMECNATDSYRLSSKELKLKKSIEEEINIIIPSKNIQELNKILTDDDDTVNFHIFNNHVIFQFDSIIFMSRLINGTYPNVSALIPSEFLLKIDIDREVFYNSIDRASLLTNEYEKNTIKFELKNKEITISSNIPEIGRVEEKIKVNNKPGESITISFSSKYMLDALRSLEEEMIELLFNGDLKPIVIKNKINKSLTQLILPIRTS